MKFRKAEIFSFYTEKYKKVDISAVFYLAYICKYKYPGARHHGMNIGVAFPHKNKETAKEFNNEFIDGYYLRDMFPKVKRPERIIYLLGEKKVKIPLLYCDGNNYSENYGSSCMFCYVSPGIICSDECPIPK